MEILKLLLLMILITYVLNTKAQNTTPDSLTIISIAQADGSKFRLRAKYMQKFAQQKIDRRSDLFKPSDKTTAKIDLLQDSLYNQKFREQAYKSAIKQIRNPTLNHIIYISGGAIIILYINVVYLGKSS